MVTLILGASTNPSRYSYKATERLIAAGHKVVLIGSRPAELFGLEIQTGTPSIEDIDTVTLYISQAHQDGYVDYITTELKPKRIIFNPGSENITLAMRAEAAGIEVLHACTLVMLATNQY